MEMYTCCGREGRKACAEPATGEIQGITPLGIAIDTRSQFYGGVDENGGKSEEKGGWQMIS